MGERHSERRHSERDTVRERHSERDTVRDTVRGDTVRGASERHGEGDTVRETQ